ncbi:MAG: DMT family transporter [Nitrospirota bacterium]|nr:DMT family transporter [Nitrospirota bacterium]
MTNLWVVLSLISAFSLATSDALAKKSLQENDEYLVAWFRLVFSLPLLLVFMLFTPVPELDSDFYTAFVIALPLEIVTVILYIKALKLSPMSLTLPFLSLTPFFLILNSYLILGEKVSFWGATGILLVVFGSYLLNIGEVKKGFFEPVKAIKREKGSVLMICVALLYSFTSSFGKMAIEHSSPLFFGITYFIALNIAFAPIGYIMGRRGLGIFFRERRFRSLVLPGFFYALMVLTHMTAMKLTKVAYMISVKRASLLIGIIYGYIFFREKHIESRFTGALLMFIGFLLVVNAK